MTLYIQVKVYSAYYLVLGMTMTQVKTAKYNIIKQHICENIESGDWLEHSKVPSENELAEQFSVSRMTARRAL